MKISAADTLVLSVPERIRLVAQIWDSIAEVPDQIETTDETLALLRKRLEDHRKHPHSTSPWSEVRARILAKR